MTAASGKALLSVRASAVVVLQQTSAWPGFLKILQPGPFFADKNMALAQTGDSIQDALTR